MSDTSPEVEVTAQYITQVTTDLANNNQEQEQIGAEIKSLQQKLSALKRDQTVLLQVREALGSLTDHPTGTESPVSAVLAARTAQVPTTSADDATGTATETPKPVPAARDNHRKPNPTAQPTLVELVREYLAMQNDGVPASDVVAALTAAHPDRRILPTVIRTTLENLVAKSNAVRTKRGSSVFYSTPPAAGADD